MCKDYLINPIPSVASWLRESKGTELKLEFCADQVNDGQLFAVALGLWNLIDLDTLCVAYASAVTDVGARVLSGTHYLLTIRAEC